jgi:glycosyltransferase involved in cell wall biosynthesis
MNDRPMFSIVIPTRNRAHLLRHALPTALEQEFDDFEVIVSDNFSSDTTPQVVREFAHPRLRSVRTPQDLSMPDHWEFALEQARGKYITFQCDDDASSPTLLTETYAVVKDYQAPVIVSASAVYFGPNWIWQSLRNCLYLTALSNRVETFSRVEGMRSLALCQVDTKLPLMLNSFCDRDLLDQIRKEAGRAFLLSPDYSFALLVLAFVPSWHYIARPLRLQGAFSESIGASGFLTRGEAYQQYAREVGQSDLTCRTPVPLLLQANSLANTFLECKSRLPTKLADFQLDMADFFFACWNDLHVLQEHNVDVRQDKETFMLALAKQSADVQMRFQSKKGTLRSRWRRLTGTKPPRWRWLFRVYNRVAHNGRLLVGEKYGFSNIQEAARQLPQMWANKLPSF